jgi:tetratricopeptide (TPR) repeat protein/AraC-like DNA-binding protein
MDSTLASSNGRLDSILVQLDDRIRLDTYQYEFQLLVEQLKEDSDGQILSSVKSIINSTEVAIDDSNWWLYFYHVLNDLVFKGYPVKAYTLLKNSDTAFVESGFTFEYYVTLGNIYNKIGIQPQSIDYYKKALDAAHEINDTQKMFMVYNNISTVFLDTKDYESAIRYALYSRELIDDGLQLTSFELATFYANTGIIYRNLKEYEKSESYYLKSLELSQTHNFINYLAQNYANLGNLYKDQGSYEQAFDSYRASLSISEQNNIFFGRVANNINMASAHRLMGSFEEALEMLNRAESLMENSSILSLKRTLYQEFMRLGNDSGDVGLISTYTPLFDEVENQINSLETQNELLRKQNALDLQLLERTIGQERSLNLSIVRQNRQLLTVLLILSVVFLIVFIFLAKRQRFLFDYYIKQSELAGESGKPVKAIFETSNFAIIKAMLFGSEITDPYQTRHSSKVTEQLESGDTFSRSSEEENVSNIIPINHSKIEDEIYLRILELFKTQKVFKDFDLSLDSLALMVGTNKKYLSMSINQNSGLNFNEFVNAYRVRYGVELILKNKGRSIPLKQLQEECGFRSEPTFYRSFRQVTGLTPNQIIKQSRLRESA